MKKRRNRNNGAKTCHFQSRDTLAYDTCAMKASYDSKAEAFQKGMNSYLCPFCGKWHKTRSKKKR